MGRYLHKEPCPSCGSKDNVGVYEDDDGKINGTCFGCGKYFTHSQLTGEIVYEENSDMILKKEDPSKLPHEALLDRHIGKSACEHFGVTVGFDTSTGEVASHFYPYTKKGEVVGWKKRVVEGKKFSTIGDFSGVELFGSNKTSGSKFLIITEGECFTPSTEVLTRTGWVALKDYTSGDDVCQVDSDMFASFITPLCKVETKFSGNLIEYKSGSYYSITTPSHNVVRISPKGEVVKQLASNTANRHYRVPRVVQCNNSVDDSFSDEELRLMVAASADFSFTAGQGGPRAGFKKSRKIKRAKWLLDSLDIKYSCNVKDSGYTNFRVFKDQELNEDVWIKKFNHNLISSLSSRQKKIIIDECVYWDGNTVKGKNQVEYSTKLESNATFIQTLAHMCGYTSTIIPCKNSWGEWYKVSILFSKTTSSVQNGYKEVAYDGDVMCVTVPTGMLLVRQNNSISVSGNCDAMAVHELLRKKGKSYNVVSVPNGAQGAKKAIQDNYDFVEAFDDVVICFDEDEPGQKAAKGVAELLSPGKARITSLPLKDPNEMLKAGMVGEFYNSLFAAKEHRPDGIIRLSQAWDNMWIDNDIKSILFPYEGLNDKLYGMRPRELITITSGSGQGKSAIVRELEYWLFLNTQDNIGILALEESTGRTQWGIVSIAANKPLHIREERAGVSTEDIRTAWESTIGTGRFIAYDHFGSTSEDNLIARVRYLIKGMDCKWVVLDHLSIVVSAMEGGDERRTIDSIMTNLRTICEETGAGIILVSHLKRGSGDKGHEMGATVTLSQLRGSQSIAQLSDSVIALERNQQADNEKEQNLTRIVVLKNRYSGYTGYATSLYYNKKTGRLYEVDDVEAFLNSDHSVLTLPEERIDYVSTG
jgi:twinkle protein